MRYTPIDQRPPTEQRAFLFYYARVMLREYRVRRHHVGSDWMLQGALL